MVAMPRFCLYFFFISSCLGTTTLETTETEGTEGTTATFETTGTFETFGTSETLWEEVGGVRRRFGRRVE